mgnify:CR=1 FL=1|jgi:hypothetical protein
MIYSRNIYYNIIWINRKGETIFQEPLSYANSPRDYYGVGIRRDDLGNIRKEKYRGFNLEATLRGDQLPEATHDPFSLFPHGRCLGY